MSLTRRDFFKRTGQAALAVGSGLSFEGLLSSCATLGFENREDVANIKWDANPAIPVPETGCYAGWHHLLDSGWFFGATEAEEKKISYYEENFSKGPAVHSFIHNGLRTELFPDKVCEGMYNKGVIPLIRYYFKHDWDNVAKGKYDKTIEGLAMNVKKFGKPFFLVPYPEANIRSPWKHVHPWAGGSGKKFKKAFTHIRHILKEEGANNAVLGLHLISMGAGQPFSSFAVDPDIIDWVGVSIYNLERESGLYRSFNTLISDSYWFFKRNYPDKPFAIWELGSSDTSRQGRWMKNAYKTIRKLPRIKLAVWAEYTFSIPRHDSTYFNEVGKLAYREAISDPYFISGPLKFFEKFNN